MVKERDTEPLLFLPVADTAEWYVCWVYGNVYTIVCVYVYVCVCLCVPICSALCVHACVLFLYLCLYQYMPECFWFCLICAHE